MKKATTRHLHEIKSLLCNGTSSTDVIKQSFIVLEKGTRRSNPTITPPSNFSHYSFPAHSYFSSSSKRNLSSAVHAWQACATKEYNSGIEEGDDNVLENNNDGRSVNRDRSCTCQQSVIKTTSFKATRNPLGTTINDDNIHLQHNNRHIPVETKKSSSNTYAHDPQHSICNNQCLDEYKSKNIPHEPTPDPRYSFHRRVLPSSLTQFSSPEGRVLFQESLSSNHAESYFPLAEQFLSQSDPAYCGVTSLIMVLNAFGIDPNVRWKGGWRWYGCEDMILDNCCIDRKRVQRVGILMKEFQSLGRCQGLNITIKRPENGTTSTTTDEHSSKSVDRKQLSSESYGIDEFRSDIQTMVQNPPSFEHKESVGGFMVVSFHRSSLGQTGDGHFSPIAAYHEASDQCLILDVARFKYGPYWVSVTDLFEATKPADSTTMESRGWFLIYPPSQQQQQSSTTYATNGSNPKNSKKQKYRFGLKTTNEAKRPAEIVPLSGTGSACPVGDIKVTYCSVRDTNNVM